MSAKHGPKPTAKRKAFKRWTAYNVPWRVLYDGKIVSDLTVVAKALNAAGATLPTGRKAKP